MPRTTLTVSISPVLHQWAVNRGVGFSNNLDKTLMALKDNNMSDISDLLRTMECNLFAMKYHQIFGARMREKAYQLAPKDAKTIISECERASEKIMKELELEKAAKTEREVAGNV